MIKEVHSSQFTVHSKMIFLFSVFCFLGTICYAESISSTELIENAKEYDGKEVVFQGEVIGDKMKRGNYIWINVFDGKNALGVFLENSALCNITFTGDYEHIGDIVEIKGIFHKACLKHGGDLDIHANSIRKLKEGYRTIHKPSKGKFRIVLWLTAVLFTLIVVMIIKK
ncbi:MAG: DNA-binding protein [Candidatus Omnitrophica bacterium]|nr:DNA-binding protein [Candidatus Omnitrophota bacterium]